MKKLTDITDYKPSHDYLLVLPDESPTTAGSIILPDRSRRDTCEGTILATGPLCQSTDDRRDFFEPGDKVAWPQHVEYRFEAKDGREKFVCVRALDVVLHAKA